LKGFRIGGGTCWSRRGSGSLIPSLELLQRRDVTSSALRLRESILESGQQRYMSRLDKSNKPGCCGIVVPWEAPLWWMSSLIERMLWLGTGCMTSVPAGFASPSLFEYLGGFPPSFRCPVSETCGENCLWTWSSSRRGHQCQLVSSLLLGPEGPEAEKPVNCQWPGPDFPSDDSIQGRWAVYLRSFHRGGW
jgi:hypothetical protein